MTCVEGELLRGEIAVSFEAKDFGNRHAIETRADAPRGKQFRVDELVNGLAIELPAAAELRDGQPRWRVVDRDRSGRSRATARAY